MNNVECHSSMMVVRDPIRHAISEQNIRYS